MKKTSLTITLLAVCLVGFLAFNFKTSGDLQNSEYRILQKWDLPEELNEVSGIDWVGPNTIAAVQDEDGIIFIYDLNSSKIQKKIKFNGGGDYEGIRISNNDAYILRSDGTLFKVANYMSENPQVTRFNSNLVKVKGIDVEGLHLDKENARLLLAEKERKSDGGSKGIYAVSLNLKNSWEDPAIKIDLNNALLQKGKKKNRGKFFPSEITTHPKDKDYYILDAQSPSLLIMKPGGELEKLYVLKKGDFEQPEGITFDPDGTMFISNEAGKNPANILKVALD